MKLRLYIFPKKNVLDPQANMISQLLARKNHKVNEVHRGKFFDINFNEINSRSELEEIAHDICQNIFANKVSEDYKFEILE